MGTYLWTIKKSKRITTNMGCVYQMTYKARGNRHDFTDKQLSQVEDRFSELYKCMYILDSEKHGDKTGHVVYEWVRPSGLWFDDSNLPGKAIGVLRKSGNSYRVMSMLEYHFYALNFFLSYCNSHRVHFEASDNLCRAVSRAIEKKKSLGDLSFEDLNEADKKALEMSQLFEQHKGYLHKNVSQ